MKLRIFLILIVVLGFASALQAQMIKPKRDMTGNLVVNGTFDEPEAPKGDGHTHGFSAGTTVLRGWKVSGGGIDVLGEHDERRVNLGAATDISQPLKLKKGVKYELSFLVACSGAGKDQRTGYASIAGQTFLFSHKNPRYYGEQIWSLYRFQFVGTGPTTLQIASTNGEEHGPHVADVCVAPVGAAARPAGPSQAVGRVVAVQGNVLTLDQMIKVAGTAMRIRTKFYLTKDTHYTAGWKPTPGSRVKILFRLEGGERKTVTEAGPP